MQCGALVITSRDPAILEVSHGAALHVDACATSALADAMRAVAAEPGKCADLRERAVARASEFTWRDTARRTREVYDAAARLFSHS